METFITVTQYLENPDVTLSKIKRYDALIDALELQIISNVENSSFEELQMEDGQMKIRSRYRSMREMEAGLKALEQARQRYINRYNGRVSVLRGGTF